MPEIVMVHKDLYYHEVAYVRGLEAEINRLRAENAEQKAELQKLYDNWTRVLALKDTTP